MASHALSAPRASQGRVVRLPWLVSEVYFATGAVERFELPPYPRRPDGSLVSSIERYLNKVPRSEAAAGDVLIFTFPPWGPSHVALLTAPDVIIHAYVTNHEVVEHRIDEAWQRMISRGLCAVGVD